MTKKRTLKKGTEPESFRLIADFKTGAGVTIEAGTVGTIIPHNEDWTTCPPRDCHHLAIPVEPRRIVISRLFVEAVSQDGRG